MNALTRTLLALPLCACSTTAVEEAAPVTNWDLFGAELSETRPTPIGEVLDHADRYAGQTLVTEGVVEDVCAVKGCWMVLREGERTMRVSFRDYGFFVPMDIHGRTVRLDGVFGVEEIPVADLKHYLEDAGKHEEAALVTEPEVAFVFEATGVRLRPEE